ncbi:hypothetical protein [uncultured Psychroserpens sp.]|uniref:hypothetical protein n=1 Tax=uncultured Psychroserpens sp. TaxID=255436 RepID=UPI0026021928|nr:hypothetical protein [uncultured Psychroserpens sp.]
MKKRFIYSGYIKISCDTLLSFMGKVLEPSKIRDRYAADLQRELKYEDDTVEIYAYEDGHGGILYQTELKGSLEDAQNYIHMITENLRKLDYIHQFEWSEVDSNDKQIGKEYEISFPEQ